MNEASEYFGIGNKKLKLSVCYELSEAGGFWRKEDRRRENVRREALSD